MPFPSPDFAQISFPSQLFLAKIQNIVSLFHVVVPLSFLRSNQPCIIVTVFTYSANFAEVLTCSTSYGCRSLGCMALPLASGFSMNCLLVQLRGEAPLNLDFLKADWLVHNRQILLRQLCNHEWKKTMKLI